MELRARAILKLRCRRGAAGSLAELLLSRESHIVLSLGVAGSTSTSAQRLEQYYALRRQLVAARDYSEAWDNKFKHTKSPDLILEEFVTKLASAITP